MPVPNVGTSKTVPEPVFSDLTVTIPSNNGVPWPSLDHTFKSYGWAEYLLPDSSVYYSNAGLRVVTDIDLRTTKKLDFVMDYLDKKRPNEPQPTPVPSGWEMWLREAGAGKASYDLALMKSWINHNARILTVQPPSPNETAFDRISEDDSMFPRSAPLCA